MPVDITENPDATENPIPDLNHDQMMAIRDQLLTDPGVIYIDEDGNITDEGNAWTLEWEYSFYKLLGNPEEEI